MCYAQEFPATVEEWMESNKIVDTEHIYTNGSEMVPIFRMRQWFQHVAALPAIEPRRGKWILKENIFKVAVAYCSACYEIDSHMPNFCPNCGADMREVRE